MTPARLTNIKNLAKAWSEIANDDEAAPTGTMLAVINELIDDIESPPDDASLIRLMLKIPYGRQTADALVNMPNNHDRSLIWQLAESLARKKP